MHHDMFWLQSAKIFLQNQFANFLIAFKVGESGGGIGGVGAGGDGGGRAPHYTLTTCDGHHYLCDPRKSISNLCLINLVTYVYLKFN